MDRERRFPLAIPRRYYPGFFGALFLVLLRVAIGWHFLYEGVEKVFSTPNGRESWLAKVLPRPGKPDVPFSAEGYLRNATGPLAPQFRAMVPDADGLDKFDQAKLKEGWAADLKRYSDHYTFDKTQKAAAGKSLTDAEAVAARWFLDLDNAQNISKYRSDLARVNKALADKSLLSFERERAYDDRKAAEADRRTLVNEVDGWTKGLYASWTKLATAEQLKAAGPPAALWSRLDWINAMTMYGMVIAGSCLILGFLTPISALACVGFLAMFYFSLPPWPGLPAGPNQEGHYLIVNKNLIELIACCALAATPSGLWIGVDALIFGRWGRRREVVDFDTDGGFADEPVIRPTTPRGPAVAIKTKSRDL